MSVQSRAHLTEFRTCFTHTSGGRTFLYSPPGFRVSIGDSTPRGKTTELVSRSIGAFMPNIVRLTDNTPPRMFAAEALGGTEVFVNASEAGDYLELHPATVQRFAREGVIPAHPVAGRKRRHWRFLRSELAEWLRTKGHGNPDDR